MSYEEDYEQDCPKCGHSPTHYRQCNNLHCVEGYIDLYEQDPIYFQPGEEEPCPECRGTGIEQWCPQCGANISGYKPEEE